MAGNTLGARAYYLYEDDAGNQYKYQTDVDLGEAVGAVLNDTAPDLPRRFEPRGVFVQGIVNDKTVRKFLIVPDVTEGIYASNASQTVIVDSTSFSTTGRKGEKVSFGTNVAATPEP